MTGQETISILIAEDHEFTRIGLRLSLEQVPEFVVIDEAGDGKTAVELAASKQPDVVLMDIEMPVMNGIDATRQIRSVAPETRVVMLTSHTSDEEIFAALGAGANGYVLKTIASKQLVNVIHAVAGGAVWLDPGIANRVLCAYAGGEVQAPPPAKTRTKGSSPPLSPRETEVLRLVAAGLSNQQIAERLNLGLETVKTHMRHIMEKLTVTDRTEAAVKATREGLV
jgi:DNA-binding NarL/FixJ family response regulator